MLPDPDDRPLLTLIDERPVDVFAARRAPERQAARSGLTTRGPSMYEEEYESNKPMVQHEPPVVPQLMKELSERHKMAHVRAADLHRQAREWSVIERSYGAALETLRSAQDQPDEAPPGY